MNPAGEPVRLAEPLAALSLMTDLARGQPSGQSLRATLLSARLAELAGFSREAAADSYYATLLRFVGCTASSTEYAHGFGGDDVDVRARGELLDATDPGELIPYLFGLGRNRGALERARVFAGALARGNAIRTAAVAADCEVAAHMAGRLPLGRPVAASLVEHFERWDGKGLPAGLAGEQISPAGRLSAVATAAVMFSDAYGPEEAVQAVSRWGGKVLDPSLAAVFVRSASELRAAEPDDVLPAVLLAEPRPALTLARGELDPILEVFGEVADLKSAYLHGHSSGVAELASSAAALLGLDQETVIRVRRAALAHDVGRVLVPTGVWDKAGPLTTAEWELVRLHPYHSERILSNSTVLRDLARLAGMHHERLNGFGYHRGAAASEQDLPARVLAAADALHALGEDRPHRPALAADEAARTLAGSALDPEALAAVLEASGRPARAREWPAGLTDREVEVLRPLVRGLSMAQIGRQLHISSSTVHTHVAHIYEKAGVSTRAAAALFAMEHGLLSR